MPNTLADWLDALARRHPPHIMQLGLDRPRRAMQRLGIQQPDPATTSIVTIAGTNGKGSVAMLLSRLLARAGISNGVYLSPHLYDFRERLQIDGAMLDGDAWVDAFDRIDAGCDGEQLTFFEWVTLAAFLLLERARPRVWVLEIGLGGRLDVVNLLDNQLNVITSIDLDHTDRLGDSLQAIAAEKAGVMRAGVTTICGSSLECFPVLARSAGARLQQIGRDWQVRQHGNRLQLSALKTWQAAAPLPNGVIASNLAMALLAACTLPVPALRSSLDSLQWLAKEQLPGRQELVYWGGVRCLLDVAHNPQAITTLAQRVGRDFSGVPAVAVFACLADKLPPANLAALFPTVHTWLVAELAGARSQSAQSIIGQTNLVQAGALAGHSSASLQACVGDGLLVVFGSFHLLPMVRNLLCGR